MIRAKAGDVFQNVERMGALTRYRFAWVSDSSGDVTHFVGDIPGVAVTLEWKDANSGGETYSAYLKDDVGQDWFLALISGEATAGSGRAALVEEVISSVQARPAPLPSNLYFIVDCSASAVRSGIVDLWVQDA